MGSKLKKSLLLTIQDKFNTILDIQPVIESGKTGCSMLQPIKKPNTVKEK